MVIVLLLYFLGILDVVVDGRYIVYFFNGLWYLVIDIVGEIWILLGGSF